MKPQKEKPAVTPAQFEATFGQRAIRASGGQIENFREGWAHDIMSEGDKAHYYRRNHPNNCLASCGISAPVRWLYGIGSYPKCRSCARAVGE